MVRARIALVNQRIPHLDDLRVRVFFGNRNDAVIVLPKVRAGSPHIGQELALVGSVQVTHTACEHDYITRGLSALQDQLPHEDGVDEAELLLLVLLKEELLRLLLDDEQEHEED